VVGSTEPVSESSKPTKDAQVIPQVH